MRTLSLGMATAQHEHTNGCDAIRSRTLPVMTGAHMTRADTTADIVLVHGAWFGADSWDAVADRLRTHGHRVIVPDLAGHGSRASESGPHITLDDHVADVVAAIRDNAARDIVLVGHSYGGRVITRVWAEVSDQVAAMVYVDAHAPVLPDLVPPPPARGMVAFDGFRLDADMVGGREALERIRAGLVEHSLATTTAPWQVDLPADLPTVYVRATGPDAAPFEVYAAVIRERDDWTLVDIDGPHLLVLSHPDEVAAVVHSVAVTSRSQ